MVSFVSLEEERQATLKSTAGKVTKRSTILDEG
jgi:hypothetical protein